MHDPNLMSWIDDGEQVRQDVNKVTEQDVKRVQASSAQAKQIQAQIKQDKIVNNNLAKFLEFLLREITWEELVSCIYNAFFIVTNPKTGWKYIKKKINDIVVVGFFAPFFWEKIVEYKLEWYYSEIRPTWDITLKKYIDYIKNLSKKHHDNIPIDKSSLLDLLYQIIVYFHLSDSHHDKKDEIVGGIMKALH